ncbi:mitochondrial inner-membrane-bound regulator-domain-containing protein [Aspergillus unguis]
MLSQSSRRAEGLVNICSLSTYRLTTSCTSSSQRPVLVRNLWTADADGSSRERSPRRKWRYDMMSNRARHLKEKGKRARGKRIQLDVPFLGEPADVLLVQNKPRRKRSSESEKSGEAQPTASADALPHLLTEFEQDRAPFDSSEVSERIDSLRSDYEPGRKLSPGDFQGLRSRLRASFTIPQLAEYVSEARKQGSIDTESSPEHREYSNPEEWRPGTSQYLETGSLIQETIGERIIALENITKNKDRSVERILRDIWQLGIVNEVGQLDLRLPTHALTLLASSEFFSFEDLASQYGTAIDLTRSLGLVRITGKQRSCESIREIIHDYLNRISSEEVNIPLSDNIKAQEIAQIFTPEFLTWVEKTYNVAFEQGSSPIPTRLYYLSANQVAAEDARRALNLALYNAALPSVPFSTYMPASGLSEIHDVDVKDTATWHDRQKPWVRWEKPLGRDHWTRVPSYISNEHQTSLSAELLKHLRQGQPLNADFVRIAPGLGVRESITASIGKSLFLRKPMLEGKEVSASQLGQMALARTFVKDVPAAPLIRNLKPQVLDEHSRVHRFRLVPTAIHADVFPPLDLEFAAPRDPNTNQRGRTVLRSAEAVLVENNVDYLLPESVADIRFTRKLSYELQSSRRPNNSLAHLILEMRSRIHENLITNREVPLPAFQTIRIPNFLLRNTDPYLEPGRSSVAEYMFEPVNDLQGTLINQYEARNHRVLFCSRDGGPYNPSTITNLYTELYPKDEDAGTSTAPLEQILQEDFSSFYHTACAVAHELDLSY